MRHSPLRVAAVLAVAVLAPAAALAFDIQSMGSSSPDGKAAFTDPYGGLQYNDMSASERFEPDGTPRFSADKDATSRGSSFEVAPGTHLNFGVSGNMGRGSAEPGWQNPQGGRMTR